MTIVHVLINCDSGHENQVISDLQKFDSIREAREVYGAFDIIAKLESPNLHELKENITEDVRKIKNIISTITLLDNNNYS